MSTIDNLIADSTSVYKRLLELDNELPTAREVLNIEGKQLVEVCREHAQDLAYYDERLSELKCMESFFDDKLGALEGKLWDEYLNKKRRAYGNTEIKVLIQGEPDYIFLKEQILKIRYTKMQYQTVVDAIKDLSWMVSNIVKLKTSEMDHMVL